MYSLSRACWIVRKADDSVGRLAVFDDVIKKSATIRYCYIFFENSSITVKKILLLLYGLKCYLSLYWKGRSNVDIAFLASYPNEQTAIRHVQRHIFALRPAEITVSKWNCFRPSALGTLPAFLSCATKLWRIAGNLVRRFHFLPACRIFSTVTYYSRCVRLIAQYESKAVFIANHYSPECLSLAAAAHRSGKKVLFTNHANLTRDTGYVPPLYCDLAAVTSQAVLDLYQRHSQRNINATFIPMASPQRTMRSQVSRGTPVAVGIFLTALTNMDRLNDLVGKLLSDRQVARVLVRSHPVRLVSEDLSALCGQDDRIEETRDMPLFENIRNCDVAICGNSTVTIEILRGGVPVLYDAGLDQLFYDYNGYLKHELVCPMPSRMDDTAFENLKRFFGSGSWTSTMRYFDAAYQQDERILFQKFNDAVHDAIQ